MRNVLALHPFEVPPSTLYKRHGDALGFDLGDIAGDVFDSVGAVVDGMREALEGALQGVIDSIKQINETIALVVRAAIGDVEWSEVSRGLGKIFREVANVAVIINPAKLQMDMLEKAPLTQHAFYELDKFSGGMLVSYRNVSTLVDRAIRGDPISKVELIQDALFAIQVAAVIYGGGPAVGAMIGNMIGRQVCSKQTEAREACSAAFVIAGAAVGGWASGVNTSLSAASEAAFKKYMVERGVTETSRELIMLCQNSDLIGDNECRILGEVFANYVKSPEGMAWEEFLAQEVARLGMELLMEQWFPEGSPERIAMDKWKIKIVDVPVDSTEITTRRIDPKTILIAASALTAIMIGAGS